jgi:L-fucose isomerase-like protein
MKSVTDKTPCLGVIYGNRDFFPDVLVTEARADIARLFAQLGIKAVQLAETDSKLGGANAPNCSKNIAMKLTVCSSCCRISATRKAWPTH